MLLLTSDVNCVLDGLAAACPHLADVLPGILVLGQADDQRRAVVRPRSAHLHLQHDVKTQQCKTLGKRLSESHIYEIHAA